MAHKRRYALMIFLLLIVVLAAIGRFYNSGNLCPGCCRIYY